MYCCIAILRDSHSRMFMNYLSKLYVVIFWDIPECSRMFYNTPPHTNILIFCQCLLNKGFGIEFLVNKFSADGIHCAKIILSSICSCIQ